MDTDMTDSREEIDGTIEIKVSHDDKVDIEDSEEQTEKEVKKPEKVIQYEIICSSKGGAAIWNTVYLCLGEPREGVISKAKFCNYNPISRILSVKTDLIARGKLFTEV